MQRDHHSGNIPKQPRLHTPIKVATWNVEGLYELTKYEQIMEYMIRNHVAIVALQETKATQTHSFIKKGFDFFSLEILVLNIMVSALWSPPKRDTWW